jgi:hypothetical protein
MVDEPSEEAKSPEGEERGERKDVERVEQGPPEKRKARKVPLPTHLEDKWFMVGWEREPALQITVADDRTPDRGAGAGITGRLLEAIDQLIEKLGGGVPPVVAGAIAGNSITIYLDDPVPPGLQSALPVEFTHSAALRIKQLIDLDDDELFRHALEIGPEARRYVDFVHLVGTSGATVTWKPRGEKPSQLPPARANRQWTRLTVEPERREQQMTLIGVLYRVIADPTKVEGSLGIKLAKESPRPHWHRGSWVNVVFKKDELEAIKEGLIGEAVEARIRMDEPVPGTGIATEHPHVELIEIARRPESLSIEDLLTEEEGEAQE